MGRQTMSKKNRQFTGNGQTPDTVATVMTIQADAIDIKGQDATINDMSSNGFEHYETFTIHSGVIGMRFRKD
jgi:hypothetical protein